jgi:transglutaminase-like putative cysteine protease
MATPATSAALGSPQRGVERLFQFSLLGMVASGYLAIAGSGCLDLPTLVLVALALVVRAAIVLGLLRLRFSTALVNAVTIGYVGFYPIDYLFLSRDFLAATVHVVFFLAITKILTAGNNRDYTYVKIIAFLELLAASLLSANLNFFASLALFLVFAVTTFATAEVRRAAAPESVRVVRSGFRRMPLRLAAVSVFITGGILSITGGLFFVLPRTAGAAFQHLIFDRYRLPGFSNQITLGQTGSIRQDSTPVMHIRFLMRSKDAPRPEALKWRGMALGSFDGRRWFNDPALPEETIVAESGPTSLLEERDRPPEKNASRLSYEVSVDDLDTDVLFFAGVPEAVHVRAPFLKRSAAGAYKAPFASVGGFTYVAQSFFEPAAMRTAPRELLSPALRQEYLELPRLDERIPRLAREWTAGLSDDEDRALALQSHLRREYDYTLDLLPAPVRDPLADFLFHRKKGHCEYFASAMAVMLRTLGIPSRVVTGFQGGVQNPITGLQLIRSSDAHSWVEAYTPARGWMTFDPTPPDPNPRLAGLWTRLLLYADAAETFWEEWVLNYDKDHQVRLAMRNSSRTLGWIGDAALMLAKIRAAAAEFLKHYGAPVAAGLIAIALLILYGPAARKAWTLRRRLRMVQRGVVDVSDATLLYSRMLRYLERRGIEKPAWLTAAEFERLVPDGELAPVVRELTHLYHELRFGGRREAGPRMISLLAQLEKR